MRARWAAGGGVACACWAARLWGVVFVRWQSRRAGNSLVVLVGSFLEILHWMLRRFGVRVLPRMRSWAWASRWTPSVSKAQIGSSAATVAVAGPRGRQSQDRPRQRRRYGTDYSASSAGDVSSGRIDFHIALAVVVVLPYPRPQALVAAGAAAWQVPAMNEASVDSPDNIGLSNN